MAEVNLILPKCLIYFETPLTPAEVRETLVGRLLTRYRNRTQNSFDGAGEVGLLVEVKRGQTQAGRTGSRWELYCKSWVTGTSDLSEDEIRALWRTFKGSLKPNMRSLMTQGRHGPCTNISFVFKRQDGQEAAEEI